jgi:hypothetical protein
MAKQQTAVDWLWDKLSNNYTNTVPLLTLIHEAKQMERQQIIDANIAGMEFIPVDYEKYQQDAEQYYTQTFDL